MTVTDYY